MLRFIFYLITTIILISVVRMVAGVLLKGIGGFFGSSDSTQPRTANSVPLGGELKKDPVCGTFVSTTTSIKKTVGGSVVHFCSIDCRDKFHA
jgi:YHS domain-containing protein